MPKSKTRFDYLDTGTEVLSEWKALCPLGEYRVLRSGSLPPVVPAGLRTKCVDSLLMASGSLDVGMAYFVINLERKDRPDEAVDQMPFCLWFSGSVAAPSGCLVQHGDWEERTVTVPPSFFDEVQKTGITPFLDCLSIPTEPSGSLLALSGSSHAGAFERVVQHVKDLQRS